MNFPVTQEHAICLENYWTSNLGRKMPLLTYPLQHIAIKPKQKFRKLTFMAAIVWSSRKKTILGGVFVQKSKHSESKEISFYLWCPMTSTVCTPLGESQSCWKVSGCWGLPAPPMVTVGRESVNESSAPLEECFPRLILHALNQSTESCLCKFW